MGDAGIGVCLRHPSFILFWFSGADLSETLRWLQTSYAVQFNWAHGRRGHVFQGRFKSVIVQEDGALDRVARYLPLNPVRIGRLGLGKAAQRRARVRGCEDPGAELVARKLKVLRETVED